MTPVQVFSVFGRNGFLGYMGPNYGLKNCVDSFMKQYPRGTKNWKERV